MIFSLLTPLALFAVSVSAHSGENHSVETDEEHSITWTALPDLPVARSDMTSTVNVSPTNPDHKHIYLIGGCTGPQTKGMYGYGCTEVTDRCDSYDVASKTYATCAPLPSPRYRHAAVNVDGKIYIVGGVNLMDEIQTEVLVYDTVADSWLTYGEWDTAMVDVAAFSHPGTTDFYAVGGYDPRAHVTEGVTYAAQSAVWKFSTTTPGAPSGVADMGVARGDISAAVSEDYAYVMGGFTSVDGFCNSLDTIEAWHIDTSEWHEIPDMVHPRGDYAAVHMNKRIYVIGGEKKVACNAEDEVNPDRSTPVNDVEVYDEEKARWYIGSALPGPIFRFVAAAIPSEDSIYVFGGQTHYDEICDCFNVSPKVYKLDDYDWSNAEVDGSGASLTVGFASAMMIAVVSLFM